MPVIPFPTTSRPGSHPALGQGRLVNAHAIREGQKVHWRRVAGMRPFAEPQSASGLYQGPRALFWNGLDLIWCFKDRVARVNSSGAVHLLNGEVSGTGPATIARNNNAVPDIAIVSDGRTVLVRATTLVDYPDGNIGVPNSVSSLDGYLLFTYGDGTVRASGLNTTEIDSLSTWKAESNPDGLLRGMVSAQLFYELAS